MASSIPSCDIEIIKPEPGSRTRSDRLVFGYPITPEWHRRRLEALSKADLSEEEREYVNHPFCKRTFARLALEQAYKEMFPDAWHATLVCRVLSKEGLPDLCVVFAIAKKGYIPSREKQVAWRDRLRTEFGIKTRADWFRVESDKRYI